jgi:serpin B
MKPAETKPVTPEIVKGNAAVALDLYARLREGEGNLFLSPISISTALGMTYAGARGETAAQMHAVLRLRGANRRSASGG